MPPTQVKLRAVLAGCAVLCATPARAQGPRTTVTNFNSWFSWSGENAIGDRWSLWTDLQLRREHGGGTPQQLLFRPGLTYAIAPGIRVGGGYAYIVTYPYGMDPIAAAVPEHRVWEQLSIAHRVGDLALTHRYRLEQRWIGVGDPVTPSHVANYREESRFRYLVRATHELGRATGLYLTAFDEVFITAGASTRNNLLDQNRVLIGGGWRFTPTWKLEVGYLEQRIWKASGLNAERNHTLSVSVFSTAPIL